MFIKKILQKYKYKKRWYILHLCESFRKSKMSRYEKYSESENKAKEIYYAMNLMDRCFWQKNPCSPKKRKGY